MLTQIINSDIIDVNEKLTANNIDIIDLINYNLNEMNMLNDSENTVIDLSENLNDLSENIAEVKTSNDTLSNTRRGN